MQSVSKEHILDYIQHERPISAVCEGFFIQIDGYVPAIATAIHNGHRFPEDLDQLCLLTKEERLYEEDPYTEEMISSQPIRMIGLDSRYEYDLNRPIDDCVYEIAWGRSVWSKYPSQQLLQRSKKKHRAFYHILHALVAKCEQLYGACIVYDIHSYNFRRIEGNTPVFNIGTHYITGRKWTNDIQSYCSYLEKITCNNIDVTVQKNGVFYGKGQLAAYIHEHFDNTLVLPTEVKKIYMDESTGEKFPLVVSELKRQLQDHITQHSQEFSLRHTHLKKLKQFQSLSSVIEPVVLDVDRQLFQLARGIDILAYINPINFQQEYQKFTKQHYHYEPEFRYRQLTVDPFDFREKLYRLPLHRIRDAHLQNLYQRTIDGLATKIDLLTSIGTDSFVYNSLKCYGEPDTVDLHNSEFLMYTPEVSDNKGEETFDVHEAKRRFELALERYGLNCPIQISNRIVAGAMVDNSKKCILIHSHRRWTDKDLNALVHHELGVHMVTTFNALEQPLKVIKLGLPGNTTTQEGLAILSEYQSGNLTLKRLKTLAIRNIAISKLLNKETFSKVFACLIEQYHLDPEESFRIVARVFRGGGFTKDHLYLKGFRDTLLISQERDIRNLYIGKTSLPFIDLIDELVAKGILIPPKYLPEAFTTPVESDPIIKYLVSSIRPSNYFQRDSS